MAVDDAERTTLSCDRWQSALWKRAGHPSFWTRLGEQATAAVGQAPARTAGFVANNILQWSFYYPAVLDPTDLSLSSGEQNDLAASLGAYRAGDLLAALAKYPAGRQPGSDDDRIYHAALLLSVGEVNQAETELGSLTVTDPATRTQRLQMASTAATHRRG